MSYKILLVEDEAQIASIVLKYLDQESYTCVWAKNGFEALEKLDDEIYHLVILDVMMPGIDGFEVLKELRELSDTPVIMLTAKNQEMDRIKGFDLGADDYVSKPFSPRELVRRIKALFKRVYGENEDAYLSVGDLKLYTQSMRLFKEDVEIPITGTEFRLLLTFMKHKNAVLSRDQLIQLSFGTSYDGYDRNIDSHIKRLRQKIETSPKNPKYLVTKYGAGYIFGGDL